MKPTKQQLEQKIEEVLSYLLCHNIADMEPKVFSKLIRDYNSYDILYKSLGIKSYPRGTYLDSIRPIR